MKIAVCEDIKEEAEWLCETIRQWAVERERLVDVVPFADAASFSFTREDTLYDALFLDIRMPGENGIALAKRLRKQAEEIPIVFVTGEKEYMMEGYEVEAVNYLLKPVTAERVFTCLDRICQKLEQQEPYVVLNTEEQTVKLVLKEIYTVEVYGHRVVYTTRKGTYEVNSSLKEVQKELADACFVLCHRGILVNLWHVVSIGKSSLLLEDERTGFREEVPVSRRMYQSVNEAFIQFYRKQSER